ncbi:MAG: saccharopine dehydrogenase NADP-binding domain-containing protein [Cytophagales bacterium]|nr:saccharopine dehydrogenase NADP-binding domain-containing protein [Cytophagales bacterium]
MKVFCLGGAGKIAREAALDLVQFGNFEKITIGDYDENAAREVAEWLKNPVVDWVKIDITNTNEAVERMKPYDIVMDGTTISLNKQSTRCIAQANCHGINLNGFGEEYEYDEIFKANGKIMVPGFGMTPGTTNMMAVYACNRLDGLDAVRVSHGSFRPIAFSKSITETTTYEYDPELPGRVVYENGRLKQVPPFARPRIIELPPPYPALEQYIIPHSETFTLSKWLKNNGRDAGLIEVRGSWPEENMKLIKALYHWGFLKNEKITVNGSEAGIMDCIAQYLIHSEKGQKTQLYGYALHVEVEGSKDGRKKRYTLTHTHPSSDGSVEGWEGLRSYTRCVGIPMAIGVILIAAGKTKRITGAVIPEEVFMPEDIFNELAKRGIHINIEEDDL